MHRNTEADSSSGGTTDEVKKTRALNGFHLRAMSVVMWDHLPSDTSEHTPSYIAKLNKILIITNYLF